MTPVSPIPVVSIVGRSDSGRTTFLEKLIAELTGRGLRVATAKHHAHDSDVDVEGKDSWRHARAGACVTMVSSPRQFALVAARDDELPLDALADAAAREGADILLTEGFRDEATARIEVAWSGRADTLLCVPEELIAAVTDLDGIVPEGVPRFGLDDAAGVADLIGDRFPNMSGRER